MPAGNTFQSDLLKLIFENLAIAGIGDTNGLQPSGAAGSLYISLHTASPGAGGTQLTNEAAYTGYARVAIGRASGNFTISGTSPTSITNVAAVTFPACTGGTETETYFAIGKSSSGAGEILVFGALNSNLSVSNGVTPQFAASALTATVT